MFVDITAREKKQRLNTSNTQEIALKSQQCNATSSKSAELSM